jgi:hypothetical protein
MNKAHGYQSLVVLLFPNAYARLGNRFEGRFPNKLLHSFTSALSIGESYNEI